MGTGLVIEETQDIDDAMAILKHPEIYDVISSDECPELEEWEFIPTNQEFLIGKIDDKPMALMIFYPDWYCHIQVLPEYRNKWANEFAEKSLEWFWNNHEVNELRAIIPEKYPNVIKFAEKYGFIKDKDLGFNYVKNGQSYNEIEFKLESPYGVR